MHRWRHPTSRDPRVAARSAASEHRGRGPRIHRNWVVFQIPTRCETSQATTQITFWSLGPYALNSYPKNAFRRRPRGSRGLQRPPGEPSGLSPATRPLHEGSWEIVTTYNWAYNPTYNPPKWPYRGYPNLKKIGLEPQL